MASEYELRIDVDAPADAVWAVVGDPAGVPRWFPKYTECTVEGDVRTLRNADGAVLVERLLERDEAGRSYAYTVTAGPPLASHRASFTVMERPGGSTIVWRTAAVFLDASIDAEARLAPAQTDGLERLKALCEAAA